MAAATATTRRRRSAPRPATSGSPPARSRVVADQIRGKGYEEAEALLRFSPARRLRADPEAAPLGRRQRREQRRPRPRGHADQPDLRRRGPDDAPLPSPRPWPRDADREALLPHHACTHPRPRRRTEDDHHGTEDQPHRLPGRLHPRLEVELVRRAQLLRRAGRGRADPRPHRGQARPRRPLRHRDPQAAGRGHRRHPHRPPRHRDRQVRLRGRRAAPRAAQDHRQAGPRQHPRDQAPRARRDPGRPVDRRAAREPRRLPPRDEARAHLRHALRRQGRQGPGLRPPRRLRDGPHRGLLRRPRPAAHPARRHRLRLRRGQDHDRPDRRQVLDQQGRDHARGLRLRRRGGPRRPRSPSRRALRGRPPAGDRRAAGNRQGGGS